VDVAPLAAALADDGHVDLVGHDRVRLTRAGFGECCRLSLEDWPWT
jgi:hypothetical protein